MEGEIQSFPGTLKLKTFISTKPALQEMLRGLEEEGEEEKQGIENLFEKVMMGNFPNLMREKVKQIQESQSLNQEEPKEAHCKKHQN